MAKTVVVDGLPVSVDRERTILAAIAASNSHVPVLCHDPRLSPRGTCGICVVEARTGPRWHTVPACATPVLDVDEIRTRSAALHRARRWTLSLLFARHSSAARFYPQRLESGHPLPLVCACRGHAKCALRSACLEIRAMPRPSERAPIETSPVLLRRGIELDMSKCIVCDRCVRICREVKGVEALTLSGRGRTTSLVYAPPADDQRAARCDACEAGGALCIDTCPTDALRRPSNPRLTVVPS